MLEYGGTYAGAYLLKRGLYLPWELEDVLDRGTIETGLRRLQPMRLIEAVLEHSPASGFAKVAALELALYMRNQLLRDTDWASMAHSLEVRVPLVDSQLLADLAPIVARLPIGAGKSLLANAPSRPLPEAIAGRAKTGFTTPLAQWKRNLLVDAQRPSRYAPQSGTPWARDWSNYVGQRYAPLAVAA